MNRVIKVEQYKYANYFNRAEQFLRSAHDSLMKRDFDASTSNSVHSAIAASDAACVYFLKQRSASQAHDTAPVLFSQIGEEFRANVKYLTTLLSLKSDSEYGENSMKEKDALEALKHAGNFLHFVKNKLPNQG